MKTYNNNKQRKRIVIGLFIALKLSLLIWWFYHHQQEEAPFSDSRTFTPYVRPQDPKPPKMLSTCQINYKKKHRISQEMVAKDSIYIRIEPLIDHTGESSAYPRWEHQIETLSRYAVNSLMGYKRRFVNTKIEVIDAGHYHDNLPEPDFTVELHLWNFSMTRGRKEKPKKTYCATLVDGTHVSTDAVWTNKYKKVQLTGEFRLIDKDCRLIASQQHSIEAVEEEIWQFYHGPKFIIPRGELELHNRLEYQLVKLKDDRYVVNSALKKLYTRLLGKFSSAITPLAKKRDGLNLPDYSGLLETSTP